MRLYLFLLLIIHPAYCFLQPVNQSGAQVVKCGNTSVSFHYTCKSPTPFLSFVHVHEDETTAVTAAKSFLDSIQKSCFVTWKNSKQRYIPFKLNNITYRFDPNRIFTDIGIRNTLEPCRNQTNSSIIEVRKLADAFLQQYVIGKKLVVALHNNTDKGGLLVTSYSKGGSYQKDAKDVFINKENDPDDFFYTTEQTCFDFLKQNGMNVVLQDNEKVADDGSLSVYCAYNKISYVNIEAQLGHLEQQKRMLAVLWKWIAKTQFK